MADKWPPHAGTAEVHAASPGEDRRGSGSLPVARLVWAALSLAFLAYVAFGSVEARIWRFNRLYYEDRRILEVWRYAIDHLPELPGGSVVTLLFAGSVIVLVASTVLGLWLLLAEAGHGSDAEQGPPDRGHG